MRRVESAIAPVLEAGAQPGFENTARKAAAHRRAAAALEVRIQEVGSANSPEEAVGMLVGTHSDPHIARRSAPGPPAADFAGRPASSRYCLAAM